MKQIITLLLIFSSYAYTDIALSSPKVSVNEQGQFLIQFTINSSSKITSKDIVLNEYQSNVPLPQTVTAFTLFEEEGSFDKFTIALSNNYPEDYFSFQLAIKDELIKNVFIFLPSRYRSFSRQVAPPETKQPIIKKKNIVEPIKTPLEAVKPIEMILPKEEEVVKEVIVESSQITTIWSLASEIAKETDADIYQIMWAIFLSNEKAFINNNINLVRADVDLIIPQDNVLTNISSDFAKESIQKMNSTPQRLGVSNNIKSLLTLTAPNDDFESEELAPQQEESEVLEDKPIVISNQKEDIANPDSFIESNTKTIQLGAENESLEILQEESKRNSASSSLDIVDLILVGLAALFAGFVLAFFYIRRNSKTSSKKEEDIYDFDNPEEEGSIQGLPEGLSVKNDTDTQQLDLASTYIEMGNLNEAKEILEALIKSSSNDSIKNEAEALLLKTL